MKIFHEAPIAIFEQVQAVTDGDYALVHLLEQNKKYAEKFQKAQKQGREIILDNSVFELGAAFDEELYVRWIKKLQPTWYIVPDVLEDSDATIQRLEHFISKYPELPGKRIGVAQGKDLPTFLESFKAANKHCDKVAISFDYSWFESDEAPLPILDPATYMVGRQQLMDYLAQHEYIKADKPVHLLGCYLPQEFKHYREYATLIGSIDTSNPCVHGLYEDAYTYEGLNHKRSIKLCDLVDRDVTDTELQTVMWNIHCFRHFCGEKDL